MLIILFFRFVPWAGIRADAQPADHLRDFSPKQPSPAYGSEVARIQSLLQLHKTPSSSFPKYLRRRLRASPFRGERWGDTRQRGAKPCYRKTRSINQYAPTAAINNDAGTDIRARYQSLWRNHRPTAKNATAITVNWPNSTPILKAIKAAKN